MTLAALAIFAVGPACATARGQIEVPQTAPIAGRDSGKPEPSAFVKEAPLELNANLRERTITASQGSATLATYPVAIGQPKYPTPPGIYMIRKIVWNPSWKPPPGSAWAKGKTEKGPGEPGNPMKVVKIFFKEPDYYIHGTDDVESLGAAESHGCLRMDPNDVAALAKMVMDHGGEPRGEGRQQTHGSASRLHDCGSTIAGREFRRGYFHPALHPRRMLDKSDVDRRSGEQGAR